ncbi:hypothetical protein D9M72_577150 [compost metagenome]
MRNIPDKFHGSTDKDLIAAFINGPLKHGAIPYMPRIDLPAEEVEAIAAFLADANAQRDGTSSMSRSTGVDPAAATPVAVNKE